ncbi:MAG: tRNA(Ile)-lysidine synthase [Clostridiales bacterium 38_11]|nr:MAG: tRNA(Ile)-lysidine synthase [Clostridiales bacterium 38_11]HBH12602.1 tRNA lysidine(34) synthetase TilS [Clostridiales bacterium]
MIDQVRNNLRSHVAIKEGQNIVLGLSGGPDSVFLFHALRVLQNEMGFLLTCAHINHMYRGDDADHDEAFVEMLCRHHNIECQVLKKNATNYAKELKMTVEEAGRVIRYGFFRKILKEKGDGYIATAHNLNDQVETVLQRIIRGTGIDGLVAMTVKSNDIIRPILGIRRKDIENYLHHHNYDYCEDKTNNQLIYGRNRLRLELIPYIEKEYNSKFSDSLIRLSNSASQDHELLYGLTIEAYDKLRVLVKGQIHIDLKEFNALKIGLRSRLIRMAIEELKGNTTNIQYSNIETGIALCQQKETGKRLYLPDNIILEIAYDKIIIKSKAEVKDFEYNITVGLPVFISEINIGLDCYETKNQDFNKKNNKIAIDYDKIVGNLRVRNRKYGDVFTPIGMSGTKKLKDFFIDEKIPREQREETPIVLDDKEIIWVAPYRMSEHYKIDESTKRIVVIEIKEV